MHRLTYREHEGLWAVCQLPPGASIPLWDFLSITRTAEELSLVCLESAIAADFQGKVQPGWTLLELIGPFPFDLTGILASFVTPLAEAGIPIFALSTWNTDWVLIPAARRERAHAALRAAGHETR